MCDYDKTIKQQHWQTQLLIVEALKTLIKAGCGISYDHERLYLTQEELKEKGKL